MSGLSHFTHYLSLRHTKGKLDALTASNRMSKQFLRFCWQEQTARGSRSIFEPYINCAPLSIINSLIYALISSWVRLSASNRVWFPCFDCELSLATCGRWLWHKWVSVSGHDSGGGSAASDWVACVNLPVSWGWRVWGYRRDYPPRRDRWHWHSARWQCYWVQSPQMGKEHWTSCRWPVQCRGESFSRNKGCGKQLAYRQAENMALRDPERERERAMRGLQLTQPKLGQRKTENQHSLKLQHANISPWQWVERVENTKEVVGRWKKNPDWSQRIWICCLDVSANRRSQTTTSLHVCISRVRGRTEMRKKTMQLREKPLVYPRYPKRQTLC